jgi:uncharacterized integral membrane protein
LKLGLIRKKNMQKIGAVLTTVVSLLMAMLMVVLTVLNWGTLTTPTLVNLLVAEIQAPLGFLMLLLAGMLMIAFVVLLMRSRIGAMLESNKLLKEVQRLQALADQAEASRIEGLQQRMLAEFEGLHARLDASPASPASPEQPLATNTSRLRLP